MKKALKITAIVLLSVFVLTLSGGLIAYASITKNAEIHNTLLPNNSISTVFYDNNSNGISGISDNFTNYEELPENLKNAVIALEDKRFYKHNGVDYVRLCGAALNNIKKGSLAEGGSTITQQLIKNTHLTQDKTIKRKLNEIKLAKKLEKTYSKDEILTMYLNVVYFGKGMYGVKEAAKGFFNKDVADLDLSECASLAAVLKNPSKYSPLANSENATSRRNLVLSLMLEQGYISENEKTEAVNLPLTVDTSATYSNTQSYALSAAYEAASILNVSVQTLLSGGYTIETYLDAEKQGILTNVIGNPAYYAVNENGVRGEGFSVILDNDTCGVSAYFGTKKRNLFELYPSYGSVLKPLLVYAPALEFGYITAATPVSDEPTDFSGYAPENYGDSYLGNTYIRQAVMTSSNVAAVKTLNMLGFDKSALFASSLGIQVNDVDKNATLALGNLSAENHPLAVLGAYAAISNKGVYAPPTFIKSISDKNGNTVYKHIRQESTALSVENAYIMTDILKSVATSGTAKGLDDIGFEVAAKTGTVGHSFGNTDAVCAGYTTENTFIVWHGNSTGDPENDLPLKETGGSYATKSARDILSQTYSSGIPSNFDVPENVLSLEIDKYSLIHNHKLELAGENTPIEYVVNEIFSKSNMPVSVSKNFDDFTPSNVNVEIDDGVVSIEFDNAPYLYYDVSRATIFGLRHLATISPSEEKASFRDTYAPYNTFVRYTITPYFYNQYGKKIVGTAYDTDKIYLKDYLDYFKPNY